MPTDPIDDAESWKRDWKEHWHPDDLPPGMRHGSPLGGRGGGETPPERNEHPEDPGYGNDRH